MTFQSSKGRIEKQAFMRFTSSFLYLTTNLICAMSLRQKLYEIYINFDVFFLVALHASKFFSGANNFEFRHLPFATHNFSAIAYVCYIPLFMALSKTYL